MSDDILARLKEMAGGGAVEPVKAAPKAKPKATKADEPAVAVVEPTPMTPEKVTGVPKSFLPTPVVVLDDGSTFSNLLGCKVCFVDPDADEIDAESLASGIKVSDLLTLKDAIHTILRIVG